MEYKVIKEIIIDDIEHLFDGYRLNISIVETDNGRHLKITLDYRGKYAISFFTSSKWLIINRKICITELNKIRKDLVHKYGAECDLSQLHNHGLFAEYALFDVAKIWYDFGYLPTDKMTLTEFCKDIKR